MSKKNVTYSTLNDRDPQLNQSSNKSNEVFNAKNTVTLPYSELMRIKEEINLGSDPMKDQKIREKQDLNQKSQIRVRNWPNTLEAKRKKKDEARFERFKENEIKRREIDEQEAILQAQQKKQIISKANQQIYEQNDRVKSFQSKMLLADALQEREIQIEINKRKKEIEEQREVQRLEVFNQQLNDYDEAEKEKIVQLENKKKENSKMLKEQHDEMKQKYIKRMQEEKIEGEIINKKTLEAIQQQKEQEYMLRQKQIEGVIELKKQNEKILEYKAHQKELEKQEEDKIKEFSKHKDQMMLMRKQREQLIFKEKQDAKQRLIDIQSKKLEQMRQDENARINHQIQEARVKAEKAEQIKQQKIQELKDSIDKHLALSTQKNQFLKAQEKQAAKDYQEFWRLKNISIEETERQEKEDQKQRCKDLQKQHQLQADEKQKKVEDQYKKDLEDAEKMQDFLKQEENTFNSWAEQCIKEWDQNGKNVKPLLLQLKKNKKDVIG